MACLWNQSASIVSIPATALSRPYSLMHCDKKIGQEGEVAGEGLERLSYRRNRSRHTASASDIVTIRPSSGHQPTCWLTPQTAAHSMYGQVGE